MPTKSHRPSALVPLFPLPSVHLCPGMLLPLHVFERRYREMTADAIEGERRIVMALLRPGWERAYEGRPPIFPVAGLGEIAHAERRPDGRYDLVLRGLSRVLVRRERDGKAYRVGEIELLEERESGAPESVRRRIEETLGKIGGMRVAGAARPSLGALADAALSRLPLDPCRRQAIFEMLDGRVRAEAVIEAGEATLRLRELLGGTISADDPRLN